jgi:hypothetical protein
MPQRMSRLALYELAWSDPLTVLAPQFAISDVALKNTCRKFDIPVPPRGYWAKLRAGKRTTKVALPPRAPGMHDEVVVGGRNRHRYGQLTNKRSLVRRPNRLRSRRTSGWSAIGCAKSSARSVSPGRRLPGIPPSSASLPRTRPAGKSSSTRPMRFPPRRRSSIDRLSSAGSASLMRCFWRWPDVAANPGSGAGRLET